jgi:hypothetical protein
MAIRERVRLVDTDEPIRLISYEDEAVDKKATKPADAVAFLESTGMDRSGLVITGPVTEFHVKPLGSDQYRDVKLAANGYVTAKQIGLAGGIAAFWKACKLIKGWHFKDGSRGDLPQERWAEQVPLEMQAEIGQYVIRLSALQPFKDKENDVPKS